MQPKKKTSKARKGWRRAHDALKPPPVAYCPRCNKPIQSHRACGSCGYLNPRVSLVVEEES